jgi:hypothetical protein
MKTRQMVMITPTDEEIEVTLNETKKSFIIKPNGQTPSYYDYYMEPLWKNGQLSIPKTRRCPHGFTDWGDGEYTLYPFRSGQPYWLRPVKEVKNETI